MKKRLFIMSLVAILALLLATTAFAETGKGNPVCEVVSVNEADGTLTMLTTDGETLVVTLPADFDYQSVAVGSLVTAKGEWTDDGFNAQWVKEATEEDLADADEGGDESGGEGNAWGEGGVYCAGGKDEPHPVAAKIAEDYGVSAEWVMEQTCGGNGFGGVMLALQSAEVTGESADSLLEQRGNGKSWGQIWKEVGIVGNDRAGNPPLGLLNKADKGSGRPADKGEPGPPDDKGGPPDDKGNGQGNNKDKDKGNGNNSDDEDD